MQMMMRSTLSPQSFSQTKPAYAHHPAGQRKATAPQQAAVQFGGLDDRYFKMLTRLSLTFWAGAAAAVGGFIGSHQMAKAPAPQQMAHLAQDFNLRKAALDTHLGLLQNISPDEDEAATLQHQELIREELVGRIQELNQAVIQSTDDPAVIHALQNSALSPEDQAFTASLLGKAGFERWDNPVETFNTFADQVLSKHTDADTVEASKSAMKSLATQAQTDHITQNTLLAVGILGSLVAAGLVVIPALSSPGSALLIPSWGAVMLYATLAHLVRDGFQKAKKAVTPKPPATPAPLPTVTAAPSAQPTAVVAKADALPSEAPPAAPVSEPTPPTGP